MTLKRIDLTPAQFAAPHYSATLVKIPGVALCDRSQYANLRQQIDDRLLTATHEDSRALLNTDPELLKLCKAAIALAGVPWDAAVNLDSRGRVVGQFVWGLLLPVTTKAGALRQGIIDELELPLEGIWQGAELDSDAVKAKRADRERSTIDGLWWCDRTGTRRILRPLVATDWRLADELLGLLYEFGQDDPRRLYDSDADFREVLDRLLMLWHIEPSQITFSNAIALLLATEDGQMGWLQQIQYPPVAPRPRDDEAKPLPDDEHPVNAAIALLMAEGASLDAAATAIDCLPWPQVQAILRSRDRMLRDAREKAERERKGKGKNMPKGKPNEKELALLEKMRKGAVQHKPVGLGAVVMRHGQEQ